MTLAVPGATRFVALAQRAVIKHVRSCLVDRPPSQLRIGQRSMWPPITPSGSFRRAIPLRKPCSCRFGTVSARARGPFPLWDARSRAAEVSPSGAPGLRNGTEDRPPAHRHHRLFRNGCCAPDPHVAKFASTRPRRRVTGCIPPSAEAATGGIWRPLPRWRHRRATVTATTATRVTSPHAAHAATSAADPSSSRDNQSEGSRTGVYRFLV
jgi:hypothetical protein